MIKMWQKSLLFRQFQFLLAFFAYTSTTVTNNNIHNKEAQALSINFCEPIKMYNPGEIKGFYFKSCYLGLSSNRFKNVMQ